MTTNTKTIEERYAEAGDPAHTCDEDLDVVSVERATKIAKEYAEAHAAAAVEAERALAIDAQTQRDASWRESLKQCGVVHLSLVEQAERERDFLSRRYHDQVNDIGHLIVERDEARAEVERLRNIEHAVWHMMDDAGQRHDLREHTIAGSVLLDVFQAQLDGLDALLPDECPRAALGQPEEKEKL